MELWQCPEELLYADDLKLISESRDGPKEAWKGVLGSKWARVNVRKTKMMIINGNTRKFTSAVFRKGGGINSILCHFCKGWCIRDAVVLEVTDRG